MTNHHNELDSALCVGCDLPCPDRIEFGGAWHHSCWSDFQKEWDHYHAHLEYQESTYEPLDSLLIVLLAIVT